GFLPSRTCSIFPCLAMLALCARATRHRTGCAFSGDSLALTRSLLVRSRMVCSSLESLNPSSGFDVGGSAANSRPVRPSRNNPQMFRIIVPPRDRNEHRQVPRSLPPLHCIANAPVPEGPVGGSAAGFFLAGIWEILRNL